MRTVLFYLCLAAVVIGLLWAIALFVPSPPEKGPGNQFLNLLFRPIVLILLGAIAMFTSQRKF